MTEIQPGDVVLDLAQGRTMHVLERYDGDAAAWSAENGYELCENYGNSRLGASSDDAVFECVYCNSIKSEPNQTYAFPESRLARVETEQADAGRPVADRIRVATLEALFARAGEDDADAMAVLERYATDAGFDAELVDEARELAEVAQTIGGDV